MPFAGLILRVIPNTPSSIQVSVRKTDSGFSFQIPADPVRNNFYKLNFCLVHSYDSPVVLAQVIAGQNAVNQAVRCLN